MAARRGSEDDRTRPNAPATRPNGRVRSSSSAPPAATAGFVEIGESLENAVRREIAEEADTKLGPVAYQGSQPWPFPAGLMLGFRAQALYDAVSVDHDELAEARWFTHDELAEARWFTRAELRPSSATGTAAGGTRSRAT